MSVSTQDKKQVLLDPFGNEVCFLFLKYGKCRYGKKCKKSHIVPEIGAPIMQKLTTPTMEPVGAPPKLGPTVAFALQKSSIKKRPAAVHAPPKQAAQVSANVQSRTEKDMEMEMDKDSGMGTDMDNQPSSNNNAPLFPLKEPETFTTTAAAATTIPKPKRLPKPVPKHPLSSIFRTAINIDASKKVTGQYTPRQSAVPNATNTTAIASNKVENWYISNRATLDPATRRLMILNKPTNARQKLQLKLMRRHHWECGEHVKENIKRHRPTSYSLKIARNKIDWCRVAPYVTLMIQAAFDMDIRHPHLCIIGSTLCAFLAYKNMSAEKCEELLISWGLNTLNARRFTAHLWGEVMVPAAGETNILRAKGTSFQVRQIQHHKDYKNLFDRLLLLNSKAGS
ncbi:hypothetical protein BG004_004836 [Podila humilis]|nr:hypothetical protein BG004_004836 [Podila humilis]